MTTSDHRHKSPPHGTDDMVYDPVQTFSQVFADRMLIEHLGAQLTCIEVNVLAGLLEFALHDRTPAMQWLEVHSEHCDEPDLH